MYQVYAIASIQRKFVYVGITANLKQRLERHNKGYEKTTKPYAPYQLIYSEEAIDRPRAREREKHLKSRSGKRELYKIILIDFPNLLPYQ